MFCAPCSALRQVFIYSVTNWNTPHILDMRGGASLIVQSETHFLTLEGVQGLQVRSQTSQIVGSVRTWAKARAASSPPFGRRSLRPRKTPLHPFVRKPLQHIARRPYRRIVLRAYVEKHAGSELILRHSARCRSVAVFLEEELGARIPSNGHASPQIWTYEGRQVSSPRFQNLRADYLSGRAISLATDAVAILDRTAPKSVRICDVGTGRPLADGKTAEITHECPVVSGGMCRKAWQQVPQRVCLFQYSLCRSKGGESNKRRDEGIHLSSSHLSSK